MEHLRVFQEDKNLYGAPVVSFFCGHMEVTTSRTLAFVTLVTPRDVDQLAAAIHCGAQEIVTFNLRDFPQSVLHPYGIRAVHPDVFLEHLLDLNPEGVCEAIRRIRRRLVNPPTTAEEIIAKYESQGWR